MRENDRPTRELAKEYGRSSAQIHLIRRGGCWKSVQNDRLVNRLFRRSFPTEEAKSALKAMHTEACVCFIKENSAWMEAKACNDTVEVYPKLRGGKDPEKPNQAGQVEKRPLRQQG